MARRIPYQRASGALKKANAGGALSRQERLALDNLSARLGLTKPLDQYAPRTQRRYLAAAREGVTAQDVNRREWRGRTESLTGTARLSEIERLRSRIASSTVDAEDYHSRESIQDLIDLYGEAFTLAVLADQVRSLEAYNSGDTTAGARRWANRHDFLSRYRTTLELDESTDPYFYYHGTI